ncbi:IS30 family transposase [Francisella philomiragia]|uniref:IS30 family transposase n=1 Tax=Francisella philomiragia TaxID=28110 RepID=UPI0035122018
MAHRHLTLSNRYCIEELLKLGYTTLQISKKIGYSDTTVKKELNRNSIKGTYDAEIAQELYESRRNSNNCKLSDKLKKLIISLLKKKISPELISGRLKYEGIVDITHKAIYNFIRKSNLKHLLFFKGKRYNYKKEGASKQGKIKDRVSISDRPVCANDRQELYHFEGDTIVGENHKGAIVTMVDRASRFTILGKSANRTASSINRILYRASNSYKILTATFDNGKEFAKHKKLTSKTGIKVFFADAYSPWQRGSNENMNRYVRQFIPKGTDFSNISHQYLKKLQNDLNNRPKKCLNYLTPNEVLFGIRINIESTI